MAGFCRDTGSLEFRPQFVPAPSTACLYQRVETSRVPHLFIPPATTDICQVQKHDNTDLHNRVFLTSMSQNASRFVIFSMTNFYIRRRKVSRAFFSISHVVVMSHLDMLWRWSTDRFYPESSTDGWASAVLHLTGAIFLRWFRQRSVCWVSATFVFVQACKKVTST